METVFMNTENGKTSQSTNFFYEFTDKLNLKNPIKNWIGSFKQLLHSENIKSLNNKNKFKIKTGYKLELLSSEKIK